MSVENIIRATVVSDLTNDSKVAVILTIIEEVRSSAEANGHYSRARADRLAGQVGPGRYGVDPSLLEKEQGGDVESSVRYTLAELELATGIRWGADIHRTLVRVFEEVPILSPEDFLSVSLTDIAKIEWVSSDVFEVIVDLHRTYQKTMDSAPSEEFDECVREMLAEIERVASFSLDVSTRRLLGKVFEEQDFEAPEEFLSLLDSDILKLKGQPFDVQAIATLRRAYREALTEGDDD